MVVPVLRILVNRAELQVGLLVFLFTLFISLDLYRRHLFVEEGVAEREHAQSRTFVFITPSLCNRRGGEAVAESREIRGSEVV